MKKLLLSVLTIASFSAFAQRSIDWQTVSIDRPTEIVSGPTSTTIDLSFTMKNNGPDTVMPGDTILYRFAVTNTNPQILFPGPTAASFRVVIASKEYAPDDTMQISVSLTTQLVANTSFNANLNVTTILQNTGSLTDPVAGNGAATRTVTWFNQFRNQVGLNTTLSNGIKVKVFPNPAKESINFEYDYNKSSVITIYDITGKKVAQTNHDGHNTKVDISTLNNGLYLYDIRTSTNEVIKTGKFNVH
jgi:hypothetical protein